MNKIVKISAIGLLATTLMGCSVIGNSDNTTDEVDTHKTNNEGTNNTESELKNEEEDLLFSIDEYVDDLNNGTEALSYQDGVVGYAYSEETDSVEVQVTQEVIDKFSNNHAELVDGTTEGETQYFETLKLLKEDARVIGSKPGSFWFSVVSEETNEMFYQFNGEGELFFDYNESFFTETINEGDTEDEI